MLLIRELLRDRDLKIRVNLRAAMDISGLRRILDKHAVLDHDNLRKLIAAYYDDAQADDAEMAETMKEDIRMNFNDPRGCFEAVLANTDGRALDFLGSILKNLILIPVDPEARMRHFQLVDRVVSSIVVDRKGLDGDFSQLLGSSVAQVIASFGAQERLDDVTEDLEHAKSTISRLKRERDELQEELAQGDAGRVGKLKVQVEGLERALLTSRAATDSTKAELVSKERDYLEQIAALRLDNQELYSRLKKHGLLGGMSDNLRERMEKQMQRAKTIQILEGSSPLDAMPPIPGQTLLGVTAARKRVENGVASQRLVTEERLQGANERLVSFPPTLSGTARHELTFRLTLSGGFRGLHLRQTPRPPLAHRPDSTTLSLATTRTRLRRLPEPCPDRITTHPRRRRLRSRGKGNRAHTKGGQPSPSRFATSQTKWARVLSGILSRVRARPSVRAQVLN